MVPMGNEMNLINPEMRYANITGSVFGFHCEFSIKICIFIQFFITFVHCVKGQCKQHVIV